VGTEYPLAEDLSEPGSVKPFRMRALDGYELGGIFYAAARPRVLRRVAVFHGGAGIPARRYRHFARFLADWGIPVLTYDYRGIGMSRPPTLRGFQATMTDWVDYDGAGAIAWLRERFPDDEMLGISHSIGAVIACGAPNAAEQARLVLIGPHTAYCGDYRALHRLPMTVLWHGLMPAVTRIVGYFPGRSLRLGEDLPSGIALQWAARRSRRIRPTGTGAERERTQRFLADGAALQRPALTITISDDAFAPVAAAQGLLSHFPRLAAQRVVFTPVDANVNHLGHFGFFRPDAGATLWPRLLAFLEGKG